MTDHEQLPPELQAVVERLAMQVHDAWVQHRRSSGWEYGPTRDDDARRSPSIVPYEKLSQEERELDRVTVRRTLDGLLKLGYRLELDLPSASEASREHLLEQAREMIKHGQPLPAYDLTKRWLASHPDDADYQWVNAMALRRCGALNRACQSLEAMSGQPDDNGERRGLLAAVYKEFFVRAHNQRDPQAIENLNRAQQLYQAVFDETGKTYHGINAATLAAAQGRPDALELARRVEQKISDDEARGDYWLRATRAEAALVQRRIDQSAAEYKLYMDAVGNRLGEIGSTRQNALLLIGALGLDAADRETILASLRPPAIVIFAGLPFDSAAALQARFPPELAGDIRTAIDGRLDALQAGVGYSGAAVGAELLFIEAMLARPATQVTIVLPWSREEFIDTHITPAGPAWLDRFQRLFDGDGHDKRVHVACAALGRGLDHALYQRLADQMLIGLARLQADTLGAEVVPLVVWDKERGGAQPDVGALVEAWQAEGVALAPENVIDVREIGQRQLPSRSFARGPFPSPPRPAPRMKTHVKAILFSDVKDYSKLTEGQLPDFIEHFVGGAGSRLNMRPSQPDSVRRVGDGLLMVFPNVRDAGLCALEMVEWMDERSRPAADGETVWSRVGLPRALRMRVALHAGPVYDCIDPMTRQQTFEGTSINYAARIEPITPGNQVYASEAFAALAASGPEPCQDFVCEYVGQTSLAKGFGEFPLYHVRRRT